MQINLSIFVYQNTIKIRLDMARASFSSKLGMIAAAAGSAVGLGNIWRFPSETASGGGALFILIYLVCILFFGVPLMMSEFMIGRATNSNAEGAFRKLAPGTKWNWVGRLGIFTVLIILGFYMVVCGWTLDYIYQSLTGHLANANDFSGNFNILLANPLKQTILMFVFTLLTAYFIAAGVKDGIEKSAKILMPLLFLLLIVMSIRAITLDGASAGLSFLFLPKLSSIKSTVFIDAMGQSFFSLSLGMAAMITYGSYFSKDSNVSKIALQVSVLDTLVALLAGIVIFSSAFALAPAASDIQSDLVAGGPGLLFITLPSLFNQLPLSALWSTAFFVLLSIAALSSTISLMEVVTAYVSEEFKIARIKSVSMVVAVVLVLGTLSAYSSQFFNVLDLLSAKIMLPIGGLFVSLFVGWYLDKKVVFLELTNNGTINLSLKFLNAYVFILKYIAPLGIIAIFLYGIFG